MSRKIMTMDDADAALDALASGEQVDIDGDTVIDDTPQAEPVETEPVEAANTDPQPASSEPPASEPQDDGQGLPPAAYKAMKDERDKRKAAENELAEYRERLARIEGQLSQVQQPQPQQQQPQIPNPATDPQGYHEYMVSQINQQQQQVEAQQRLMMSERLAITAHGAETVEQAKQAFAQYQAVNPQEFAALYESFGTSQDPVGSLVNWHKRQSVLSEIGDDPQAYRDKLKAEILAEMQGGQPSPQTQARNLPPRGGATPSVGSRSAMQFTMDDADSKLFGR